MRMLRWICGITKLDKIRNEIIRGTTKVGEIAQKIQEIGLVEVVWACEERRGALRRNDGMEIKVQGRRKRGKPKRRWLDKVKDDIKEKELSDDEVYDRAAWRRMSSYIGPT